MLGGGNPVSGSNPSGTGATLQYVGGNVYAGWSGQVIATNSTDANFMDFTTGNRALKAILSYSVDTTSSGNSTVGFEIKINNEIIYKVVIGVDDGPACFQPTHFVLAAQSRVQIKGTTSDGDDTPMTVCITAEEI